MLLIKNVETIVSTTKHPTKDPLVTLASESPCSPLDSRPRCQTLRRSVQNCSFRSSTLAQGSRAAYKSAGTGSLSQQKKMTYIIIPFKITIYYYHLVAVTQLTMYLAIFQQKNTRGQRQVNSKTLKIRSEQTRRIPKHFRNRVSKVSFGWVMLNISKLIFRLNHLQ